ncbi:MAG: hypothetical protein U1E54_01355 [Candidatus Levybacteria bacterium]|nr:hypothetical protein [Candidatus Levybacteria bacterium]
MKNAIRIFIRYISTSLLITLVLLTIIRFELLSKPFVFEALEKHNVYEQLPSLLAESLPNNLSLSEKEKIIYTEFIGNISPQIIKPLIVDNLTQILDFLNGESKDIVISFSLQGIGFENASGIRWSIPQIPDKNLQEKIMALNGIGNTLIIAIPIVAGILIFLFFLYGRLTIPKQLLGGKEILLSSGIYITAISLISKYSLTMAGKELLAGQEPSQKLLGLLFASLFSDIATTLLTMGLVLILLWLTLFIGIKVTKKQNEIQKTI